MADGPQKDASTDSGAGAHQLARTTTDRRVLEVLVCPVTRDTLIYDRARSELVSRNARLAYPIRDGVPIMIVSEARTLEDDERPGFGPPSQMRKS